MNSRHIGTARGILRNTAVLMFLGVLDKAAGLLVAILVARFLGTAAMGLFALLFSVALIAQAFVSFGMSENLVREAATSPGASRSLCVSALKLVMATSAAPCVALVLAAFLVADAGATRVSLLIVALGVPLSGAFVVSQAIVQGTERVLLLTMSSIAARAVSVAFLVYALYRGAGIEAAFASRALFQGLVIAVFAAVLLRGKAGSPSHAVRGLLNRSIPFAAIGAMQDLGVRLPSFVLPAVVGLPASGIFDSANRVRSSLGMAVAASIVGLMPSLARSVGAAPGEAHGLIAYGIKYMCLGTAAAATVVALLAEWIIVVLFGPSFAAAAVPLQLLAWAQVFAAVDAVLQQTLLARGRSLPAIRHQGAGVLAQLALIAGLTAAYGLEGAAVAALLSALLTLALDLRYVVRHVAPIAIRRFAVAPLASVAIVGAAMLAANGQPLSIRLGVAVGGWAIAMALFRVVPMDELRFMKRLVTPRRVDPVEQLSAD
jgi:O-antigen/teichoic acid export membrane protein